MLRWLAICPILPLLCAASPSEDRLRSAAAQSVALIQRTSTGFHKSQDCFSCHGYELPAIALRMARERGVPVDEAAAHAVAVKGMTRFMSSIDRAVLNPEIGDFGTVGDQLVGLKAAGVQPNLLTAIYARQAARSQDPAGYWATLDTRPPSSYSYFRVTAVELDALHEYAPSEMREDVAERTARAKRWLLTAMARNTEDLTFRLIGLARAGATTAERSSAVRELMAGQRADGGWSQMPYLQSDAYSTGEALVALHEAGEIPASDARWAKGLAFLLSNQKDDGSWHVATRMVSPASVSPPYFETGFPYGKDQVISTEATCWASMAVMAALPKAARPASPNPLPELMPKDEAPWMRTALFGTEEQLKAALDASLDPNVRTAAGTTLLMMAAPDTAKMRMLIARGADVKAKSKAGVTALMAAAAFRGSADGVRLLLSKGAEASPGPGVQYNASPLFMAVLARDPDNVAILRRAGADSNRKIVMFGLIPQSPLFAAVGFGDTTVLQALIDAGANLEETDSDGMNALHGAALSGHPEAARLLMKAGISPNRPDKFGYTPLMYAASVDFGTPDMVLALIQGGADPSVTTKDGSTALADATRYGIPHLQAALSAARKAK